MRTKTISITVILFILTGSFFFILKKATESSYDTVKTVHDTFSDTQSAEIFESVSEQVKASYDYYLDKNGYIYVLRGVSIDDPRSQNLTSHCYMSANGGDATWLDHDMGNTDSKWQSHTIDVSVALRWAKGGGNYKDAGYIAYKKMSKEDFGGVVFGGIFAENQCGIPGLILYDGYIAVSHETTIAEAKAKLKARGVKLIY